jgi:transcriptional regulator with XRE-family HTH domain
MAKIAAVVTHAAAPQAAVVLSKAVVRAAEQLDLRQTRLAQILGLSTATASRLAAGDWRIPEHSKTWELATAFVRVYRSLSAITGGEERAMRAWLHSHNDALTGEPAQLITTTEGLIHVLHYLDAARGRH